MIRKQSRSRSKPTKGDAEQRAKQKRRVRNKEKHGDTMEMIKTRGRGKKTNNKARKTAESEWKRSERWR